MSAPLPEIPWSAARPSDSTADVPPVLDLVVLRNRCLGNEQLVWQILGKLDSALGDGIEILDLAWERRDLQTVATAAHRLKGTAANVAAERLRLVAEALEAVAIAGQADEAERQIGELRDEQQLLSVAIREQLTTLTRELKSK